MHFEEAEQARFLRGLLGGPQTRDFQLFALDPLHGGGVGLYGLVYPGYWGCLSWTYLTLGRGFAVLSQPLGATAGTSLTNIWSAHFCRGLMSLKPVQDSVANGRLDLYEHYYDKPEIARVTLIGSEVRFKHVAAGKEVAKAFERITGEPMPDFAALDWGSKMIRRVKEQWGRRLGR
jgi:hypothetical protein